MIGGCGRARMCDRMCDERRATSPWWRCDPGGAPRASPTVFDSRREDGSRWPVYTVAFATTPASEVGCVITPPGHHIFSLYFHFSSSGRSTGPSTVRCPNSSLPNVRPSST
uniref:Uncharacterized protein n=1 Tax=Plectus sambesii TaxID=2011161 RepID=A0A914WPY9_9BILA